jgi:hypothetical protein
VAATDWRQMLNDGDRYQLCPGAAGDEIAAAEAALEAVFPAELRAIYTASNGVLDRPGEFFVIWRLPEVVARNQDEWGLDDGPFRRRLVGFGNDGSGAPFCVPRDGGAGVFAWSATTGGATRLGRSLTAFWSGWLAGTLPPY